MNSVRNTFICNLNRHEGVVLFATNRHRDYDPAIARRIEDLHIPAPDAEQRVRIWTSCLQGMKLDASHDARWVRKLDGRVAEYERHGDPERPFSPADIRQVLKRAGRRAVSESRAGIARADLERALDAHLAQLSTARACPDPHVLERATVHQLAELLAQSAAFVAARHRDLAGAQPREAACDYKEKTEALLARHEKLEQMLVDHLQRAADALAAATPEEMLARLKRYAAAVAGMSPGAG